MVSMLKITQTVKWFEENLKIDNLNLADELGWDYYCFANGSAYEGTEATLNILQIGKLSPLPSNKIEDILKDFTCNL
jgi:hypothetical protein